MSAFIVNICIRRFTMMNKRNEKNILKTVGKAVLIYDAAMLGFTAYEFIKARGLNKENDLDMIDEVCNKMFGLHCNADKVVNIKGTALYVSYNPYMHLYYKTLGAIATRLVNSTEVYVDNTFRKMSKVTQLFILCHELGHYECKHDNIGLSYNNDRIKAVLKGQILDIELEADTYAAETFMELFPNKSKEEITSIAIKALKEQAKNSSGFARKELELRVAFFKRFAYNGNPEIETMKNYVYWKYSKEMFF